MPVRLRPVDACSEQLIDKEPAPRPGEDRAVVDEWRVAVVRALEIIDALTGSPLERLGVCGRAPLERPVGNGLGAPVDRQRIVIAGRSEAVADLRVDRVAAGAGIDQKRQAPDGERDGKRVRVGMAAIEEPMTAGVDRQMIAALRTRHEVARRRQSG